MAIRSEPERPEQQAWALNSAPQPVDGGTADHEEPSAGALAGEPEAWEPWETRLVIFSLLIGFAGLLILGWLVDRFILS